MLSKNGGRFMTKTGFIAIIRTGYQTHQQSRDYTVESVQSGKERNMSCFTLFSMNLHL